jgi:gluconokinase
MLLVLFGFPCSGKSYIGKLLESEFGFYHYEADEDLTSEIKVAIRNEEKISDRMRDDFINRVCQRISELLPFHQNIVITQTFTKENDRRKIRSQFREATFIRVKAEWSLIESRLKNRNGHIVSKSYAELSKEVFELSGVTHFILRNNEGKEAVRVQLWSILSDALRYQKIFRLKDKFNSHV